MSAYCEIFEKIAVRKGNCFSLSAICVFNTVIEAFRFFFDVTCMGMTLWLATTNGVKQGCVLAPTLFSTMLLAMLFDVFKDRELGIDIRYRTDGCSTPVGCRPSRR